MKDKCQIIASPLGGYSLLVKDPKGGPDYIISYLNKDGSLNEYYLECMIQWAANQGANVFCDFPFWIHTQEAYEKISPFWFKPVYNEGATGGDPIGFKTIWNEQYFKNQKRIAEICNKNNMIYKFYLFDQCGTRRIGGTNKYNPWKFFDNFFFSDESGAYRRIWIERILMIFKDYKVIYGLCNEPRYEKNIPEFLSDTFVYLLQKGVPSENIELGLDYKMKEFNPEYGATYRKFRNEVCRKLKDDRWASWLKSRCISPVHGASLGEVAKLLKDTTPGGTRRILYSFDGLKKPRPDYNTAVYISDYILETKHKAKNKGKVHFEIVIGKQKGDPLDSIQGVSDTYFNHFGKNPENYGKFPNVKFPPDPKMEALRKLWEKIKKWWNSIRWW
jgi:hypothetical protein